MMLIDIFHDTACPWCRIGKKHLFDALAQWQGEPVIRWRTFLLDDTIPPEGVEFRTFMKTRKKIGAEKLNQLFDYTQQIGAASGVKLNFDKISLAVNTTLSHRLIALAPEESKNAVVEAVYKAYFEDSLDISNVDVLVSLGTAAGMNPTDLRQQLNANAALDSVIIDATFARRIGITSVPFFIFNNKFSVKGSQSVEVFRQALNQSTLLEV